jgi:hypothetical protein
MWRALFLAEISCVHTLPGFELYLLKLFAHPMFGAQPDECGSGEAVRVNLKAHPGCSDFPEPSCHAFPAFRYSPRETLASPYFIVIDSAYLDFLGDDIVHTLTEYRFTPVTQYSAFVFISLVVGTMLVSLDVWKEHVPNLPPWYAFVCATRAFPMLQIAAAQYRYTPARVVYLTPIDLPDAFGVRLSAQRRERGDKAPRTRLFDVGCRASPDSTAPVVRPATSRRQRFGNTLACWSGA